MTQKNFGFPEYYQIISDSGTTLVHHSRILRFDGVRLPYELMIKNQYWGDSVLSRLFRTLLNYKSSFEVSATLLQDFSQGVYRLKDLDSIIVEGDGEIFKKRLELVDRARSVLNAIVLDKEEDFERKSTNVAGLPELLNKFGQRLVSATDMPLENFLTRPKSTKG